MKRTEKPLPSMKLQDMLAPSNDAPAVAHESLTNEQRALLRAYWRARTVRFVGGVATVRLVADYATDDYGYGTVARSDVGPGLRALRDLGFNIDVEDLDERRTRSGEARAQESAAADEVPRRHRDVGDEPAPRGKRRSRGVVDQDLDDPELGELGTNAPIVGGD